MPKPKRRLKPFVIERRLAEMGVSGVWRVWKRFSTKRSRENAYFHAIKVTDGMHEYRRGVDPPVKKVIRVVPAMALRVGDDRFMYVRLDGSLSYPRESARIPELIRFHETERVVRKKFLASTLNWTTETAEQVIEIISEYARENGIDSYFR